MKQQLLIALAILALAAFLMVTIIKLKSDPEKVELPDSPLVVDALEVYPQDLTLTIKSQGTVQPKQETNLVAEVAGRIVYLSPKFVEGGFVKQGEVLIRVSDTDYQLQLQRARTSVSTAQSNLAQEESLARVAQQEWQWRERKALDKKAKDAALRKPQLNAARANVRSAYLEVKNAQEQLSKTAIKAPYDAIIRSKKIEQGQFVSPGSPLGGVFSIRSANVRLAIPQEKIKYLDLPDVTGEGSKKPVRVYLDKSNQEQIFWQAHLERSEGVIDPQTHFMYLIAEISDPYNFNKNYNSELRMGTFVYADIEGKQFSNIIKLADIYLHSGSYVWVINENMQLEKRIVNILFSEDKFSYIKSGLSAGEKICTTVLSGYLPGTKIKINQLVSQKTKQIKAIE